MIHTAQYIISSPDVNDCPNSQMPEYAFIGRSNVGKSSLINMLCHNPKLAKTSQKPGKTLLINHFLINEVSGQLKVEVGDAVVVLHKVFPDAHGVFLLAVEGAVHELDLRNLGIKEDLQIRAGLLQRHVAYGFDDGAETVAAAEGTAADALEVDDFVL